ncbi:PPOX class F420-dependent oxidoreductase [Mycolicibacterium tokaiense]|uniref:Pyridoxamine 5'-phosphate oxidase-related FMN-binding protein n=1 Tax=Mycolicibacterium tokaiense TaxID=39695 RepID=A0A378THQ1_9MYCO|nr:PPOX class F420-dependent oxidoreductase [Mycolicibacterium tokaiense]STZ59687.1 pyridoxamine 5'-phosphate oxidase-related FMN-binding protein [Mycolicibacterium tokaiense]
MVAIPAEARHLFRGRDFAHLAAINSDGSPQVSAVWVDLDGDLVIINTTEGLVKTRNMRANPRVGVSIVGQSNPYESVQIQGKSSTSPITALTKASTSSPGATSERTRSLIGSPASNG